MTWSFQFISLFSQISAKIVVSRIISTIKLSSGIFKSSYSVKLAQKSPYVR